jgi:hypothetical protein
MFKAKKMRISKEGPGLATKYLKADENQDRIIEANNKPSGEPTCIFSL